MRDAPDSAHHPLLPVDFDFRGEGATSHPYFLLDCFSARPLAGNQLAVFVAGEGLGSELMQALAREMNLSESVFLLGPEGDGDLRARIFTPARELPFAGHPVLGTAVLAGLALGKERIELETGAGVVRVDLERDERQGGFAWMRQPIPSWGLYERRTELLGALGVARSGLPVEAYRNGPLHVYVELPDEGAVGAVEPDLAALAGHPEAGVNCFAGPCRESTGPDGTSAESPSIETPGSAEVGVYWKTRMFAPALGVAEDPATGSAAGPLAVHLARHRRIEFGEEIEIRQGEELGRPSRLYARVEGTTERIERVEVGGSAVIVGRGEIVLPSRSLP